MARHIPLGWVSMRYIVKGYKMEKTKELIELIEFEYGDCNCDSEKKCSYCKIVDELKEWKEAARSEADEVNRLQTENTNLKEQDKIISNEIKTYIEIDRKLQAENKKLRDALEYLNTITVLPEKVKPIIREALKEIEEN